MFYGIPLDSPLGIAIFIAFFAVMFTLMDVFTAQFGWKALAAKYRTSQKAPPKTRGFYSLYFNTFGRYNGAVSIGFTDDAVYIKVPLFPIAHPPLLIPVKDIVVTEDVFFGMQRLSIGRPEFSSPRISKEIAETIKKMQK